MHIDNLYKDQSILMFRRVFALEKLDGTTARVAFRHTHVWLSSGGSSHEQFKALFDERETASPRPVVDPAKYAVLRDAQTIAVEWVTNKRMDHVLSKLPLMISHREVIDAMIEDVLREGRGEIVDSKAARRAIGVLTGQLLGERRRAIQQRHRNGEER